MTARKRIIRVFPRRTKATPTGELVRTGFPFLWDEADEIHVSVAFTWDLKWADRLAREWQHVAPVTIGGPATGSPGGDFEPGRYLADGYTITSRGCPNRCWFCSVWKREGGTVRELPIRDGWNLQDDNLLACSDDHIRAVFAMLARQKRKAEFTGGLEPARLKDWHVDLLAKLKPQALFMAYDSPGDYDALAAAGQMLGGNLWPKGSHRLRCYVLVGYPKDTMSHADERLRAAVSAGFFPMAMLWRNDAGDRDPEWITFAREWANPTITAHKIKAMP